MWRVEVETSPQEAFDYVADIARHAEWGSHHDHLKIVPLQSGAPAEGMTYRAESKLFGIRNPAKLTVTKMERPHTLEFEHVDRVGIGGHVFKFAPQNGGTLITRQFFPIKQLFLEPLYWRLFRRRVDANFNESLGHLKETLERGRNG